MTGAELVSISLSDDAGIDSFDSPMLRIPGGTFRMGSDKHYPEEAPVHRVTVDEFWIDKTPVTNRQFRKFVNETAHRTFAETLKEFPAIQPPNTFTIDDAMRMMSDMASSANH